MKKPLNSAKICHLPQRKWEKKRGRMESLKSRKCWCSTWKTQKLLPYKWRGRFLPLTPCSTGKQPQVDATPTRMSVTFKGMFFLTVLYLHSLLFFTTSSFLFFLVVQEAVQFCVTVCEFSVANSISGVRKMLPLVWSTDASIKDAVVQAYRRLYLNPQGDTIRCIKLLHM